jgi:ABC-type multidrug transport system fused ATPase/permease subunit
MGYFSKHQAAELNSRISADIEQIGGTFTTNLAEFFRQFIIIIGGVIILGITSWRLALVMLGIVPVLAVLTVVFGRWIRKLSRSYQDKVAESNIVVGEALMGIANVKSFTNEAYESKRYSDKVKEVAALGLKGGIARGGFFSFIIFCLLGSIIFIVWYGIKLKISGEIPAAEMMSFMFYTIFISASIGGIAEQYGQIQKAVGATDRVLDIMNIPVEPVSIVHPRERGLIKLEGKVEFRNVGFSYPTRTDFTVLRDISFTATKGQTIALVGHSGSGKSTIAQLLLRFYDPDQGNIFFDGKDAKDFNLTELRENMAIVPQDVLLFGGTITENIAYGKPGATQEEIVDAARQANALTFIESFPDKFETKVGDRGIQLSGGQRQRIAIARAVLKNPGILILDEATSSLDSESERVVQDALEKLMVGRTSFVIAHRLSTIRHADKIVVIDKGEVVETGTHDELMERENGVYRTLNNLQFQFTSSPAAEI